MSHTFELCHTEYEAIQGLIEAICCRIAGHSLKGEQLKDLKAQGWLYVHCCPTKMWRYSWFGTDFLLKGNSAKPPFARSSEPWRSITQFFTH